MSPSRIANCPSFVPGSVPVLYPVEICILLPVEYTFVAHDRIMKIERNQTSAYPATWIIIIICLLVAGATIWWFGKRINTIDQKLEIIENQ